MRISELKKTAIVMMIAAVMLISAGARALASAADCTDVSTDKGPVTGILDEKSGVCAYKGIPFAAPPVGDLRFRAPIEHDPWSESIKAFDYGSECVQNPLSLFPSDKVTGSEDCLFLNVWALADAVGKGPRPVMVFVHGGGFLNGSGSWGIYDGTTLSGRGDVVVVTFNYRLGQFGFLVHEALRDDNGASGNYGLYDQVAALKWVQKNIASFGGDPANVTVFGESAGGISVGLMLISPLAKGLFSKAIIESGPAQFFSAPMETQEKVGVKVAEQLGCGDAADVAACLRSVDSTTIMTKAPSTLMLLSDYELSGKYTYQPVIDGVYIPDVPAKMFARGEFQKDIPIMIGSNTDEASFFSASKKLETVEQYEASLKGDAAKISEMFNINVDFEALFAQFPADICGTPKESYNCLLREVAFTCPTRSLAKNFAAVRPDVYLYLFGKAPDENGPLKDWGAFHGSELAFVFHNFEFMGIRFKSKDNTTASRKIMAYWTEFSHTGKPAVKGLPEWEPFDPAKLNYMYLDVEPRMETGYRKASCDFLEPLLFGN